MSPSLLIALNVVAGTALLGLLGYAMSRTALLKPHLGTAAPSGERGAGRTRSPGEARRSKRRSAIALVAGA